MMKTGLFVKRSNFKVRKSETPQRKLLLFWRQPYYTQCVTFLAMNGIGEAKLPQDRDEDVIFYTKLYFQKYCFVFLLHEISQKTTAVSQIKTLKCFHFYSFFMARQPQRT